MVEMGGVEFRFSSEGINVTNYIYIVNSGDSVLMISSSSGKDIEFKL